MRSLSGSFISPPPRLVLNCDLSIEMEEDAHRIVRGTLDYALFICSYLTPHHHAKPEKSRQESRRMPSTLRPCPLTPAPFMMPNQRAIPRYPRTSEAFVCRRLDRSVALGSRISVTSTIIGKATPISDFCPSLPPSLPVVYAHEMLVRS